jgi:hypothetical protein
VVIDRKMRFRFPEREIGEANGDAIIARKLYLDMQTHRLWMTNV